MPVGIETRNGRQDNSMKVKANGEEDSSNSEDESSYYDEDDAERRKGDCLDDIQFLEQQFSDLKELLYQEKVEDLEHKMQIVHEGHAPDYVHPLSELDVSLKSRLDMSALQHENVVENIEHKYLEEVASTHQNFKEMCRVTRHRMSSEIVDKMRRLQEETVVSELNFESTARKRRSKVNAFQLPEKRKKTVIVNGPCVVYMLRDMDIMEDLTDIRKGRASLEVKVQNQDSNKHQSPWR